MVKIEDCDKVVPVSAGAKVLRNARVDPQPDRTHATVKVEEEGQPSSSSSNVRSQFIAMGFSPKMVDRMIQEHGDHDSNTLLESLLSHSAPQNSGSESSSSLGSLFDSDNEETSSPLVTRTETNQDMKPEPGSYLGRKLCLLSTMKFTQEEVDLAFKQLGEDAPLIQLVDCIVNAQGAGFSGGQENGHVTNEVKVSASHPSLSSYDAATAANKRFKNVKHPLGDDGGSSSSRAANQDMKSEPDSFSVRKSYLLSTLNFSQEEVDLAFNQLGEEAPLIQLVDCIVNAQGAGFSGGKENGHATNEVKLESEFVGGTETGYSASRWRLSSYDDDAENRRFKKAKHLFRDDGGTSSSGSNGSLKETGNCMVSGSRANLAKPPYFLYGNCVGIREDAWQNLSRFLFGVKPEFVNSKSFSSLSQKDGFIHNLPTEGRCVLARNSPMTIEGVVPFKVEDAMQPQQLEQVLGYPLNHTDILGLNPQDRIAALRFCFQTDTVGHLLSVLKEMYPDGLSVLSIYSGVGGAEVALHRLGIQLKCVVSVEESEVNRKILKRWWGKTKQAGQLRQLSSIKKLKTSVLEDLMKEFAGFDLVAGGTYNSSCRGGTTVSSRMGMDFCKFNEYVRVVQSVRSMHRLK